MTEPWDILEARAVAYAAKVDPEHRFTGLPLVTGSFGDGVFHLFKSLTYHDPERDLVLMIKKGFPFDFASVPALFRTMYPPAGIRNNPYGLAALVHDWAYVVRHAHKHGELVPMDQSTADAMFYECLRYLGCRRTLCWAFYTGVKAVGWWPWWRDHEKDYRQAWLRRQMAVTHNANPDMEG